MALRFPSALLASLALLVALACRDDRTGAAPPPAAATPVAAGASAAGEATLPAGGDSGGIQVYIPGTRYFAVTDASGAFLLENLAVGQYKVMARAAGFLPTTVAQSLAIAATDLGGTIHLDPVKLVAQALPPPPAQKSPVFGAVEGTVEIIDNLRADPELSRPTQFEPVRVAIEGTSYSTVCAPDGRFLLWNLPADQYKLTASAAGATAKTVPVRVLPGEKTSLNIQLLRGAAPPVANGRIDGGVELYDDHGELSNAFDKITVRLLGASLASGLAGDGSFVFAGLPREHYKIIAEGDGFGQTAPVDVDLTSSATVNLVLTLAAKQAAEPKTGAIAGLAIKNKRGEADQSGIAIALTGTQHVASTDEQGRFTLGDLPAGIYRLAASAPGYKIARIESIEVKAGEETALDDIVLEPEREAPKVVATIPADGEKQVLIRRETQILIRFNRKMDIDSLRAAIAIAPDAAFAVDPVEGRAAPNQFWVALTIYGSGKTPAARFRTDYAVTIADSAVSVEGDPLEAPYRFGFSTGDAAVIATDPANNGRKPRFGPDSPVMIYFNAPMDAASLAAGALRIVPEPAAVPSLQAYIDPATGWTRLSITAVWQPDTDYKITVSQRARTAARDSLMNAPYTFQFRTAKLIPLTGPLGASPSP